MASSGIEVNDHGKRPMPNQSGRDPAKRQALCVSGDLRYTYCHECDRFFARPTVLCRHLDTVHGASQNLVCDFDGCAQVFTRKDTLRRHREAQHGLTKVICPRCHSPVRKDGLNRHMITRTCNSMALDGVSTKVPRVVSSLLMIDLPTTETTLENAFRERACVRDLQPMSKDSTKKTSSKGYRDGPDQYSSSRSSCDLLNTEDARSVIFERFTESGTQNQSLSNPVGHPEIVPDSPRAFYGRDAINPPLDCEDTTVRGSTQEALVPPPQASTEPKDLAARMLAYKEVDPLLHAFQSIDCKSDESRKRLYGMKLGSSCALCSEQLGTDSESVFQHAKGHLPQNIERGFECLSCRVKFAFKRDLDLHQTWFEKTGFSQENAVIDAYDSDDWVAAASREDRTKFIDRLRHWELQQSHWFLDAIREILRKCAEHPRAPITWIAGMNSNTHVQKRPKLTAPAIRSRRLGPSFPDIELNGWCETFGKASLKEAFTIPDRTESVFTCGKDTELTIACSLDWTPKSIKRLLDDGADAEHKDRTGRNALHRACINGSLETAKLIVDRCADVNIRDSSGSTALICVVGEGSRDPKLQHELAELLLENSGDVQASDDDGWTPLLFASINGQCDVTRFLLRHGARIDVLSSRSTRHGLSFGDKDTLYPHIPHERRRHSPLAVATQNGHSGIVHLLLEAGGNVNFAGLLRTTALMYASWYGNEEIAKIQLKHGADTSLKDEKGRDAMAWARKAGHEQIVGLLEAHQHKQLEQQQKPPAQQQMQSAQQQKQSDEKRRDRWKELSRRITAFLESAG